MGALRLIARWFLIVSSLYITISLGYVYLFRHSNIDLVESSLLVNADQILTQVPVDIFGNGMLTRAGSFIPKETPPSGLLMVDVVLLSTLKQNAIESLYKQSKALVIQPKTEAGHWRLGYCEGEGSSRKCFLSTLAIPGSQAIVKKSDTMTAVFGQLNNGPSVEIELGETLDTQKLGSIPLL